MKIFSSSVFGRSSLLLIVLHHPLLRIVHLLPLLPGSLVLSFFELKTSCIICRDSGGAKGMHQGCEPVAMGHKSLLQRRGAPSVVHYYRSAARKCSDGIEGALDSVAVVEHYRSRLQIPVIMASSSDFGWISPPASLKGLVV